MKTIQCVQLTTHYERVIMMSRKQMILINCEMEALQNLEWLENAPERSCWVLAENAMLKRLYSFSL